jgi:hypothetical protein
MEDIRMYYKNSYHKILFEEDIGKYEALMNEFN